MTAFFCEKMKYLNKLPKAYLTLIFRKNNILKPTPGIGLITKSLNTELTITYL